MANNVHTNILHLKENWSFHGFKGQMQLLSFLKKTYDSAVYTSIPYIMYQSIHNLYINQSPHKDVGIRVIGLFGRLGVMQDKHVASFSYLGILANDGWCLRNSNYRKENVLSKIHSKSLNIAMYTYPSWIFLLSHQMQNSGFSRQVQWLDYGEDWQRGPRIVWL